MYLENCSSGFSPARNFFIFLMSILERLKNKFTPASRDHSLFRPSVNSDPALLAAMTAALRTAAIPFESTEQNLHVRLPDGLIFSAEAVERVALGDGRVRICIRIAGWHADYFPQGITEYQHALGSSEERAIQEAFKNWINMDLPVLQDAVSLTPSACTVIQLQVPAASETIATSRQVILGPVAHLASRPAQRAEEHPFCPCCLFTECMPVLHDLLQTNVFLGVRLFVSRDQLGKLAVDCRVNGEDFPAATEPLIAYAAKWQDRGLEFRKQYLMIRSAREIPAATVRD